MPKYGYLNWSLMACTRLSKNLTLYWLDDGYPRGWRRADAPPWRWLQVRLMLVLAPATCALAGIGAHEAILLCARSIRAPQPETPAAATTAAPESTPQKKKIVMKGGKVRGHSLDRKGLWAQAFPRPWGPLWVALWVSVGLELLRVSST